MPSLTGSSPVRKTIGMTFVAAAAATAELLLPEATIRVTFWLTSSDALAGIRCVMSFCPAVFKGNVTPLDETFTC